MSIHGENNPAKPKEQGLNAFRQYLTGMARDVPKELRRSASLRRAIRRRGK